MPAFGESVKRYYPGLVPVEAALWRAWLREYQQDFDSFEYNVLVGVGSPLPANRGTGNAELDAALERAWLLSTQRKIDALGHRGADATIFEVKESATMGALGQLLVYDDLLPAARAGLAQTELALVCARLPRDLAGAFEAAGVQVYVVRREPLTLPPPGRA